MFSRTRLAYLACLLFVIACVPFLVREITTRESDRYFHNDAARDFFCYVTKDRSADSQKVWSAFTGCFAEGDPAAPVQQILDTGGRKVEGELTTYDWVLDDGMDGYHLRIEVFGNPGYIKTVTGCTLPK